MALYDNFTRSEKQILKFIKCFTDLSPSGDIKTVFTQGCCYWFAEILALRFGGEVVYDESCNHFVCKIGEDLYDITGNVTDKYEVTYLQDIDPLEKDRVERDCIWMVDTR